MCATKISGYRSTSLKGRKVNRHCTRYAYVGAILVAGIITDIGSAGPIALIAGIAGIAVGSAATVSIVKYARTIKGETCSSGNYIAAHVRSGTKSRRPGKT